MAVIPLRQEQPPSSEPLRKRRVSTDDRLRGSLRRSH